MENCFENVVSDLWKKKFICPQKCFQKKNQKLKTNKNYKRVHNIWQLLGTKLVILVDS